MVHLFMTFSEWKNFDDEQLCNVYVDSKGDLIGFESLSHKINFVNSSHKLYEIINSPHKVDPIPFNEMRSAFLRLGADNNR